MLNFNFNFSLESSSLMFQWFFLRISEEIIKVEQAHVVNETMMASSVVTVHTAPDQSQADEGVYEPKQSQPNEKETYEASSPFCHSFKGYLQDNASSFMVIGWPWVFLSLRKGTLSCSLIT